MAPPVQPAIPPSLVPIRDDSSHPSKRSRTAYSDDRFLACSNTVHPPATPPHTSHRAPVIKNSIFRPAIPADRRIQAWSSPFDHAHSSQSHSSIPPELLAYARLFPLEGLAPHTKSAYGAGILRFTQFCDTWDISEADRMPASPLLLVTFISHYAGSFSGSTFNLWLSGLRAWHIAKRAPWYGDNELVKLARTAATRLGTSFKKPPRAPISLHHLHLLKAKRVLSRPFDAAVWATALVSFFGCRHLGETTVPSSSKFSPSFHVSRATPITFKVLQGTSSASFRIPWTKTTKSDGALVVITSRSDDLCPVAALRNHLSVNHDAPTSLSLFGFKLDSGSWSHMLKSTFMPFVSSIWSLPSGSDISGHSFRIGGAVALLLSGVSPDIVAATGGWTSMAFLLYWRRLEDIIPMSTSHAYLRSHLLDLSSTMEDFRVCSGVPSLPPRT